MILAFDSVVVILNANAQRETVSMATFGKSRRFEENAEQTPAPGAYDPKSLHKVPAAVVLGKRQEKVKGEFCCDLDFLRMAHILLIFFMNLTDIHHMILNK